MPRESLPHWHPCDEFIEPLVNALKPLVEKQNGITREEIKGVLLMRHADSYLIGKYWLQENMSPQYADRFDSRIEAAEESMAAIWAQLQPLFKNVGGYTFGWDAEHPLQTGCAETLGLEGQNPRVHLADTYLWLVRLRDFLRQRVRFDKMEKRKRFIPSELQRQILAALSGASMTADGLEQTLAVSRSTLYSGKTGGLNELVRLGIVTNDRKLGGYYRWDAPPPGIAQKSN